jgi:GT2 family glycosyltransferase
MTEENPVSVVVLTYNRPQELARTLDKLMSLPEHPPVIVVDNASKPGVVDEVTARWPAIQVVRCDSNLGAAGRNEGVARVGTPYVAFCDDDTWWAPGALSCACSLFDQHPRLGVINARVMVGDKIDPTCDRMACSPLRPPEAVPGTCLIAFMAGAVVMRTQAYRQSGGYEPRFFLGGEESLMGLDMAALGWQMAYVPAIVTHHAPSSYRQVRQRQVMTARNRLWTAWLRLPPPQAWRQTRSVWRQARRQGLQWPLLIESLKGLAWIRARRQVVPRDVARMHALVFGEAEP